MIGKQHQWEVEIITHPNEKDKETIVARMNVVVDAPGFLTAVDEVEKNLTGAYTVVAVVNLERASNRGGCD